jgi:hypothetical protein
MTALALIAACAKKEEPPAAAAPTASAQRPETPPAAPMPDVGKLGQVTVTAQGSGPTAGVAVQEAMKMASLEVNGATIDTSSIAVKFGLDATEGQDAAMLRGAAFAEEIAQRSRGAITGFKLINMAEPTDKGGLYKVTIEAAIAKFRAPEDAKKIKIVIAPIRVNANSFLFGTKTVPATQVATNIHQHLIDALTATGRFSVLDREFTSEVQQELDLVAAGQTPNTEMAKLGQTLSADIVWVGTLNDMAYLRNARKLLTSDREFVSYSGGWSVSQRILSVATRQIMLSNTLHERAPSTDPTTMDQGIDAAQIEQSMESAIADETVSAILSRTFPVTVLARDGANVVLSQGGQSVKEGARYVVVLMGKEMTDPQTQQSLGRMESPCCEVVIDKVDATMAYGHLENVKASLDEIAPADLQIRQELRSAMVLAAESAKVERSKVKAGVSSKNAVPEDSPPVSPTDDNKKW